MVFILFVNGEDGEYMLSGKFIVFQLSHLKIKVIVNLNILLQKHNANLCSLLVYNVPHGHKHGFGTESGTMPSYLLDLDNQQNSSSRVIANELFGLCVWFVSIWWDVNIVAVE